MTSQESAPCAAIFDLDRTISATSSALAMHKPLRKAGMLKRTNSIISALFHIPFLLLGEGEARNTRIRRQLQNISAGWGIDQLNQVVRDASHTAMHARCYVEALELLQHHKTAGHKIVIATASPLPLVQPLADILGADYTLATTIGVKDGLLTGEVSDFNHGAIKADATARLAESEGWDLSNSWAYSDSVSDLHLLKLVGHPVAVNPDRQLRQIAREEDWPIMRFTHTVELRGKDYVASGALMAGIGLAAGLGSYLLFSLRGRS